VAGEYFVKLTHEDAGSLEFLLDVPVGRESSGCGKSWVIADRTHVHQVDVHVMKARAG
jgi:hypothetical protein